MQGDVHGVTPALRPEPACTLNPLDMARIWVVFGATYLCLVEALLVTRTGLTRRRTRAARISMDYANPTSSVLDKAGTILTELISASMKVSLDKAFTIVLPCFWSH